MKINPEIFKAYDIRGVYPEEVNEDVAYQVGRGFVDFVGAKKIIIARDVRISGPKLRKALIKGIREQGADVVDIGLASTDMFYFACGSMKLPGITITASHNPSEFNGFKMVKKMPDLVSGEKVRDVVLAGNFSKSSKKGKVEEVDISEDYKTKILSLADLSKISPGLKIVVDPANGMGSIAFDLIYKDLPIEIKKLFFELDGTFPNHAGDPMKQENRVDIEKEVLKQGADLGFAPDSDADRFFVIDKKGNYVQPDFISALFSKYAIEKNNGGTIVQDAICGWAVRDLVKEAGGTIFKERVGHVFIKAKMEEKKAIFGIEKSAHYYLPNFFFAETAVGVSLILLEMLGAYGKTLEELVNPLREKYHQIDQINTKVKDPDEVIARVKKTYEKDYEIEELDGVSVIADNWHANVRKSNTEPVVRLNVEAIDDKKLMEEKRDEFLELIQK